METEGERGGNEGQTKGEEKGKKARKEEGERGVVGENKVKRTEEGGRWRLVPSCFTRYRGQKEKCMYGLWILGRCLFVPSFLMPPVCSTAVHDVS